MHRPICLVVCWILISISRVVAQTSTGFSRSEQYRAIKVIVQQFYDRGLVPTNIQIHKPGEVITRYNRPGEYDMFYCGEAGQYLGWFGDHPSGDKQITGLTDLALRIVVWENDIRKLHVPDEVWRPAVQKFESAALAGKEGLNISQLAAELNARNARAGRTRPKFVTEGGCGAGEIEVHFALKPPDGQLFLIPVFLYKVCQVQQLSPTDPKSCDRWKEVFGGTVSYVSGDYVYQARWADGVVRCGSLGFNQFNKKQFGTIEITKLQSLKCSPGW